MEKRTTTDIHSRENRERRQTTRRQAWAYCDVLRDDGVGALSIVGPSVLAGLLLLVLPVSLPELFLRLPIGVPPPLVGLALLPPASLLGLPVLGLLFSGAALWRRRGRT